MQKDADSVVCEHTETLSLPGLSDHSWLIFESPRTIRIKNDETITDTKVAEIVIGSILDDATKRYKGGYTLKAVLKQIECLSMTLNTPTIKERVSDSTTGFTVGNYGQIDLDFEDLGDDVGSFTKCGTRTFSIVQKDGTPFASSWITVS